MNNKYLFYSFILHFFLILLLFFGKINKEISPKEIMIEIVSSYSYQKNSFDYKIPKTLNIPTSQLTEKFPETENFPETNLKETFLKSDYNSAYQPQIAYNLPKNSATENMEKLNTKIKEDSKENSTYILEGEIKNRKIIKEVLPKYPKSLQVNSKVKIKFSVLANGEVANMIVVEKSYSEIEKSALNALKNWQFSSMSQNEKQQGIITFNFELE